MKRLEMGNSKLFDNLENILKEHKKKSRFMNDIRSMLFEKYPAYRIDFNLIILELQNWLENTFDRIIQCYTRPKQKDEDLYDDEVINAIKARLSPDRVRHYIIFNSGFSEKKILIYKLFNLSKPTREIIDKLNSMRNAIVHRYDENDKRFVYRQKNILHNYASLVKFLTACLLGIDEIQKIETNLLDAIDKAEKELG